MSLLNEINSTDIQLLIDDLTLLEENYVINYVIDPYDIFNFTFPYGLEFDKEERKSDLDRIGEEMIAYRYLFHNYNPILLNEYKPEFFRSRDKIYERFSNEMGGNLIDQLTVDFNEENEENKDDILKQLENSASFLLSSALLTETFINSFWKIYNNKLQINDFKLKTHSEKIEESIKKSDESIILNIFLKVIRTEWSGKAYQNWVKIKDDEGYYKKIKEQGKNIRDDLRTTYTDYVAIDRVFEINRHLQAVPETQKYIFLYFSSASKSKLIFSMEDTINHLPQILCNKISNIGKRYNVLRSVRHSFLLFLFQDEDRQNTIFKLKTLKEIADEKEDNEQLLSSIRIKNNEMFEAYEKRLSEIRQIKRDSLETESIELQIKNHEKYRNAISDLIYKLKKSKNDLTELINMYKKLLDDAKKTFSNVSVLQTIKFSYSIHSSLNNLLEKLLENKELTPHKGADLIRGNYQHLPILLFFNQPESNYRAKNSFNIIRNLLYEVIGFVVKSPKGKSEANEVFFKNVESLYNESEKNDTERLDSWDDYAHILIKAFVFLILDFDNEEKNDLEAYKFVSDIFESDLKPSHLADDEKLTDTYQVIKSKESIFKRLKNDYYYFLIWVTRRNKSFDESLKLANEAIEADKDDPRFYHGKCLTLYNKFFGEYNDTIIIKFLDEQVFQELVESAKTAIEKYSNQPRYKNSKYEILIKGSIVALQNTLLYCLSSFHFSVFENTIVTDFLNTEFADYSLEKLRNNYLVPIKRFVGEQGQDSKEYPEFAHTEAVLELCEAIDFSKSKNYKEAKRKIEKASDAISRAIRIDNAAQLYKNTRQKILETSAYIYSQS